MARNVEMEARNTKIALDFAQEFIGDKNIDSADKYMSPNLIEHNPLVGDGLEEFKKTNREWFKDSPKEKLDIRRVSAEGDCVWIHYKIHFLGQDVAVVDIFRFENDKIVEHWDVIQAIPAKSENPHPMF